MYAVDLHAHTRFFHGRDRLGAAFDPVGARLLAAVASARGLDGVALTNHDYFRPFESDRVTFVPGIEISTSRGHVLVVGPDPPAETEPGTLTPNETVDLAHQRGCAAIVAHPYRNSTVREVDARFDAIEVNGKHPRTARWSSWLARRTDLPLVGGSDAHYPFEVGRAFTLVDADGLTPEAIVEAIVEGRVEARVEFGLVDRLIRTVYRRVHGQRGHLDHPEERPPWARAEDAGGSAPGDGSPRSDGSAFSVDRQPSDGSER